MQHVLTLDYETRSYADLKKVGAWAYSEDPTTEIICVCWALDDGPIRSWAPAYLGGYDHCPPDLEELLLDDDVLVEAHNVAFEYSITLNVLAARMGWPMVPVKRWRDTMAVAAYYSMPPSLDRLCRALGLSGKDPEGDKLITKYSKLHLKTAKLLIPPEDVAKWIKYCSVDVDKEREVSNLLGTLPEEEEEVFLHDFTVMLRGLRLDPIGIEEARIVVNTRSKELEEEFKRLTGLSPGQVAAGRKWLAEQGLELENLQKGTIQDVLADEENPVPYALRRVLQVRMEHSKASTKKLDAMMRQKGKDGRARFQFRYHGAVTGRNTGTGFQPLNLVRSYEDIDPEHLVRDIRYGDPKYLDMVYGDAMEAVSKASRHWIRADDGNCIRAGDFSSIEAIVNAFLAGEEWKMEAFRQNKGIYELAACKIFKLPLELADDKKTFKTEHPDERQDGKRCELAFGYQGALGAWRKFDNTDRHSDESVIEICKAWRAEHPMIVAQWYGLQAACIEAVTYPGRVTGYRHIGFERVDGWLTMILPDGKRIWYWAPEIRMRMPRWHDPDNKPECASGDCDCQPEPQVTYMAQKDGRWHRVSTYGGKLCENAVQATSRQLLKPAEIRAEKYGYPVILSVYDEVVSETPIGFGSLEEFKELMEVPAGPWCEDWPIRAEVWEGGRYRK